MSYVAVAAAVCAALLAAQTAWAQPPVARPLPPPKPAVEAKPPATDPPATAATPAPAETRPASQAAAPAAPAVTVPALSATTSELPPSEATLGVPIMPNAYFLGSYDAGGAGQRFYLFGSQHRFADVVSYYRTVLRDRGELVFDSPGTHMFEVGRFRSDQVAFPPGVTVKDYAFSGLPGLANPQPGASPESFPTVIQIVPPATLPTRPR